MSDGESAQVSLLNNTPGFWRNTSTTKKVIVIGFFALFIAGVAIAIILVTDKPERGHEQENTTQTEPWSPTPPIIGTSIEPTGTNVPTESTTSTPPGNTTGTPPTLEERKMFAHYYLSATQEYNRTGNPEAEFRWDIVNAIKAKLDGFIVRVGGDPWQLERLDQMYEAASKFSYFKVFANIDLTYQVNSDEKHIISVFKRNLDKAAQLKIDGRPVFGTYRGNGLSFGELNRTAGWTKHFLKPLEEQNISVYFMPYWPSPEIETFFKENPFIDGFQYSKAWTFDEHPIDFKSDEKYIKAAHEVHKTVISSVSPCHFAHSIDHNVVYRSEDNWHLRWQQLIDGDSDFGQVISWNRFHESHAVGPINPLSSASEYHWYENMSNKAFTKMLPYYVEWFKTRKQPPLTENIIYFYHRPHSKFAPNASNDEIPKPETSKQAVDAFVIHSFIKDAGTYDAQIFVDGKPLDGEGHFQLKGGEINHVLVPFDQGTFGDVELILSQNNKKLASTNNSTKLLDPNRVEKWNFNFNTTFITFTLDA